jgi:hypothetical protein
MSARGALRTFIVVLLALVCIGFMAVVGMSAAATPADDGGDHEYDSTEYDNHDEVDAERSGSSDDRSDGESTFDDRHRGDDARRTQVNVRATDDVLVVAVDESEPLDVTVEAVESRYAGEGRYTLAPGETVELPAPSEPSTVRVLAESDDARLEVRLTFESREYECGGQEHSQVAPSSASYEWQAGGNTQSETVVFERPPFECPIPDDGEDPGGEEPPGDPEAAYDEAHDRVWDGYGNGRDSFWDAYEAIREALWDGYEDGQGRFWAVYEQATGDDDDGDDDDGGPRDRVNETRDFAERVGNDTRNGADRVENDTRNGADRVENDTGDDADRLREDAENGSERVREDGTDTIEDVRPGDGDNGSDPEPPAEPPEDLPPEDFPPEEPPEDLPPEEPPEDLPPEEPPEDVLPGDGDDDNGSEDPVPEGSLASADADADAGRDGDTAWVEGSGEVTVANGAVYAEAHERLELAIGEDA